MNGVIPNTANKYYDRLDGIERDNEIPGRRKFNILAYLQMRVYVG